MIGLWDKSNEAAQKNDLYWYVLIGECFYSIRD